MTSRRIYSKHPILFMSLQVVTDPMFLCASDCTTYATILEKIFLDSACENCFNYNFLHASIKNQVLRPTPFSMLTNHHYTKPEQINIRETTLYRGEWGGGIVYNNLVIHFLQGGMGRNSV